MKMVMWFYKKIISQAISLVCAKTVVVSVNSASILGYHQPKEPEALKKLKK